MKMIQWTKDPSNCTEIMEAVGQPPCCDSDSDSSDEEVLWVDPDNNLSMKPGEWVIVENDTIYTMDSDKRHYCPTCKHEIFGPISGYGLRRPGGYSGCSTCGWCY